MQHQIIKNSLSRQPEARFCCCQIS